MRTRSLSVPALIFFIGACSSLTGPDSRSAFTLGEEGSPTEFSSWLASPGTGPVPDLAVESGEGEIRVQGAIGTPVPCYDVEGFVERLGFHVWFTIRATAQPVTCLTVVAAFGFESAVRDLRPGTYSVRVTRVLDGRAHPVLESEATVR